jgi:hypothetical protein
MFGAPHYYGPPDEEGLPTRCPDCGSRTCESDEACVAHEDNVPYEDNDQRLGGFDNPNDVED